MTEKPNAEERPYVDDDGTGNPELDAKLFSEPVLKGEVGIDTAQVWMAAFLITMAAVALFAPALGGVFIGDARELVAENLSLHSFVTAWNALPASFPAGTTLSMMLSWNATPERVAGSVALNVMLHAFACVLLYLLARRLTHSRTNEAIPMLAGLLFAVTPVAAAPVCGLMGRGELASLALVLASLACYVHAFNPDGSYRSGLCALSLLSAASAWAFGATAAVAALILVALDWVVYGPAGWRSRAPWLGAYVGLTAAFWVAWAASGTLPSVDAFREATLQSGTLLKDVVSIAPLPVSHPTTIPGWVGLAVTGAGFVMTVLRWTPGAVLFMAGVLAMLPAVFPAGALIRAEAAYAPTAAICLLLPWAFSRLPKYPALRVAAGFAAFALIVVSGAMAFQAILLWQDSEVFWRNVLARTPGSATAQFELGRVLVESAEKKEGATSVDEAAGLLESASRSLADGSKVFLALARTRHLQNRPADALSAYQVALKLEPENRRAALGAAEELLALGEKGDTSATHRAVDAFRYAASLGPLDEANALHYGLLLARVGDLSAAETQLRAATGGDPDSPAAAPLKIVSQRLQQVKELRREFAERQKTAPNDAATTRLAARIRLKQGQTQRAAYTLWSMLGQDSSDYEAWALLGVAQARMQQTKEFLRDSAQFAAAAKPEAWAELARQCASERLWGAAQEYLTSGLAESAGVAEPLVALGDLAARSDSPNAQAIAAQCYLKAAERYPQSPTPWVRLCDTALTGKEIDKARSYLDEAERRGLSAEESAARRAKTGGAAVQPGQAPRVVVR